MQFIHDSLKILMLNLSEELKDITNENDKTLKKEIKEDPRR
jgi:hypothetical protein